MKITKRHLFPLLPLLLIGGCGQRAKQPNIILFLVDDMGRQDTSEPFWKLKTPGIPATGQNLIYGRYRDWKNTTDIGETHNLSENESQRVNNMARVLGSELRRLNAQMPLLKETGTPVPWPDEALN